MTKLSICVDFDGTMVTHNFPVLGEACPLAIETVKELMEQGHRIILWTMRSGASLSEAVKYMEDNGIELFGINKNPTQASWTTSPKAYGNIYIDDAALGCPTHILPNSKRPQVDWVKVRVILKENGVLPNGEVQ